MKRAAPVLLLVGVLVVLGIWIRLRLSAPAPNAGGTNPSNVTASRATTTETPAGARTLPNQSLLGQTILRDYASPDRRPENDLTLMSRLMENSLLLLKSAGNRPLSANEDWANLLRGQNAAHERFLPDSHIALNQNGQLIDRWGTPLFFHAVGSGRYEIRSAGPDKKLWTDDDIHRDSNGSFRRGAELNPPALFNPGGSSAVSK